MFILLALFYWRNLLSVVRLKAALPPLNPSEVCDLIVTPLAMRQHPVILPPPPLTVVLYGTYQACLLLCISTAI